MGLSGVILKDRRDFSPEELLRDVMTAVFRANLNLSLGTSNRYDKNGRFKHAHINISSKGFDIDEEDRFIFEIFRLHKKFINEEWDEEFDYIDSKQKLYNVAIIDEVADNKSVIFKFAYEYLKLNPKDYIWFEDDFAFNFQDMEKLRKLPYDEYWCYKNPKNI
ncbi:hypothetical protein [Clostridium felsineum]|uniref:Uncharacterized protein n=1 Tax=Clostridium felsineum TaxID=36839 RepID=A0A1S8KWW6_9CLOT|nr:hypothetical protein [Clostridium felsineum]URZ00359.1 hypothetical protein CLAUR_003470 [Clostridium felsineum]URZ07006.1 hypothetical protein CLROS_023390 [Clostridium felsineum]URZ12036.1 hypothetical protein CROST_027530 [Clostridium felsineum]